MQKSSLRPLRLISMNADKLDKQRLEEQNEWVNNKIDSRGLLQPLTSNAQQIQPGSSLVEISHSEQEARLLLKRTPSSYLLNQGYGLWVFISLFLITVIVTRKLSVAEYGVYAIAMAAFNTIAYIVAFGLEDATTTFVPRVFAEHGRAAAALLVRRLLAIRLAVLTITVTVMLFTLPILSRLITALPVTGSAVIAAGLRSPSF